MLGRLPGLLGTGVGSHSILVRFHNVGKGRHEAIQVLHCTIYAISLYWILAELYFVLLSHVLAKGHTVGIHETTIQQFIGGTKYGSVIHGRRSRGFGDVTV